MQINEVDASVTDISQLKESEQSSMQIKMISITVRQLVEGYCDKGEGGVVAYGGKLDVRPPYQREFIYSSDQEIKVIETVMRGFPLNSMYWVRKCDDNFEILDGQQRTLSICRYYKGSFSVMARNFDSLYEDEQQKFLDYKLYIYVCRGNESEKLEWFKTINIAGAKLTDQEIRNAVYGGPFVNAAKVYFSRRTCPAYNVARQYLRGDCIRQDYLETAIKWQVNSTNSKDVESYMNIHKNDANATELWRHFLSVIEWVKATFKVYRKAMKGINWGKLYNEHGDRNDLDPMAIEKEVDKLMRDEDVTAKAGIYIYVLRHENNEKYLNLRTFMERDKITVYEAQKHLCARCQKPYDLSQMQAHHKVPWHDGGKTTVDNCLMICRKCHEEITSHLYDK